MKPEILTAKDTLHTHMPVVEYGNINYTNNVLDELGYRCNMGENVDGTTLGRAVAENNRIVLKSQVLPNEAIVPDLIGLGARDAVYMAERLGLKAQVEGVGVVRQQSLPYGHQIKKGEKICLRLGTRKGKNTAIKTYAGDADSTNVKLDTI